LGDAGGLSLAGATAPAAGGAAPVLAGVGQASAVGRLSVPPSWAADGGFSASGATPATVAGWTSAAPHSAPVNTVPGGVPSMASTGRTSGLGAPRYGLKPKVMPKSTVV
jgi:PPE-repeat protein